MQNNASTVVVLGTGGTIAGTAASAADNVGYTSAQIGVATLVAAVPALAGQANAIADAARKEGVLVLVAGPNVLRFVPPLTITETEFQTGLSRLRNALQTVQKAAA